LELDPQHLLARDYLAGAYLKKGDLDRHMEESLTHAGAAGAPRKLQPQCVPILIAQRAILRLRVKSEFGVGVLHHNHFVVRPYARLLVISIAVAVVSACNRGASTPNLTDAKIDALFAEWNTRDSPGCGVGVKRHGAMLFERGYGMANLERKIPISPATIFDPASIAKPFTALSTMLLAEQGKLSLDDEVWKHVPEWVNRQDRVTIRHLLGHTAGLRDAFLLIELAPPPAPGVEINEHILRTLARQRGVNFAPSTEFSYNNGGYNLLASIVARVSGQSFREFATVHILRPLGMTQSSFRGGLVAISPDHALGYHGEERVFHLAGDDGVDTSAIVGNSGLFTTVADLLRFAQNFGHARVGRPDHLMENLPEERRFTAYDANMDCTVIEHALAASVLPSS
jgi:CubicO group peptidase (beta-lactamase class C family)